MIPEHLTTLIDYVYEYVGNMSNDWFSIKKELLNNFPPKDRSRFSRRHFSTKKHILNDFDLEVIKYWEEKSGRKLIIDKEKLHPEDWVQKSKGWGIREYNEQRQRKKETSKTY